MARKYYAVYYGDGKGKIFTRLKDFQRATAKKSAKLYRGVGVKLEAELWLKNPAECIFKRLCAGDDCKVAGFISKQMTEFMMMAVCLDICFVCYNDV